MLRAYHFSAGSSTRRPTEVYARVRASSSKQAVSLLQAALPKFVKINTDPGQGVDFVYVNFNSDEIVDTDIDDIEEIEEIET